VCFLTRSYSNSQPVELLKGSAACQDHVAPAAVIVRKVPRQPTLAFLLAVERHCKSPLSLECLDESLDLAVGLWPVGPGPFGFQPQHRAGLAPLPGAVSTAVIGEHPAAGNALAVEPRHSPKEETHRRRLLLVWQRLDVGQPRGVIHSHMGLLIASTRRAAFAAITSDAVANPFKAGQLFGVDVDHVAELGPFISADWLLGLQVPQVPKPDGLEPTANGRERSCQLLGDAPHRAAFMAQCPCLLLLLRVEGLLLGAENATSIHQTACTAGAVASQLFVRSAEADPCLRRQISQGGSLVNVSTYKPFPAEGCQPGIRVGMHRV
jgi:hypothetical protein